MRVILRDCPTLFKMSEDHLSEDYKFEDYTIEQLARLPALAIFGPFVQSRNLAYLVGAEHYRMDRYGMWISMDTIAPDVLEGILWANVKMPLLVLDGLESFLLGATFFTNRSIFVMQAIAKRLKESLHTIIPISLMTLKDFQVSLSSHYAGYKYLLEVYSFVQMESLRPPDTIVRKRKGHSPDA